MATQIIKQRVCDLCGSDEGVTTFRVGVVGKGRGVSPDLCEAHQAPLREAMAAVPTSRSSSALRKVPPVRTEAQVKKLRKRA
jgi:hypothetical protein